MQGLHGLRGLQGLGQQGLGQLGGVNSIGSLSVLLEQRRVRHAGLMVARDMMAGSGNIFGTDTLLPGQLPATGRVGGGNADAHSAAELLQALAGVPNGAGGWPSPGADGVAPPGASPDSAAAWRFVAAEGGNASVDHTKPAVGDSNGAANGTNAAHTALARLQTLPGSQMQSSNTANLDVLQSLQQLQALQQGLQLGIANVQQQFAQLQSLRAVNGGSSSGGQNQGFANQLGQLNALHILQGKGGRQGGAGDCGAAGSAPSPAVLAQAGVGTSGALGVFIAANQAAENASSLGALQALQGIAGGQQVSNGAPRGWISSDLEILKRLQATLGLLSGANAFHGSSSGAGNGVLPVTKSPAAADPSGSAEPEAPPASETAAPPEADEGKTEKVEELKRE